MQTCDDAGNLGPSVGEVTPASGEVCGNMADDDCNGMADDGCGTMCRDGATRPCYDGPMGTDGRGICRAGMQTCARGAWGDCARQSLPQAEVCDGMDNDCDGTTDGPRAAATCPMPPNGTVACMGRCVIATCSEGFGDCNGSVADGCETDVRRSTVHCGACGHACAAGQSCIAGTCATEYGDLVAGAGHVCVRRPSGSVYCWGGNTFGELGTGDTTNRTTPAMSMGLSDSTALSAGGAHNCATRASGQLVCFGYSRYGQIGLGPLGSTSRIPSPTAVPGVTDFAQFITPNNATCVRQAAGTTVCWGEFAMLGEPSTDSRTAPGAPVPGLSDVVRLMNGGQIVCARRSGGDVLCWGYLPGRTPTSAVLTDTPTLVPFLRGAVDVIGRNSLLCGLFDDGRVLCTGVDFLGNPLGTSTPIAGWTDIVALETDYGAYVDTSDHVVCALRRGGQVSCFGGFGSQGGGTMERDPTALVTVAGLTDAVRIAAFVGGGCAMRATGAVVCWGRGDGGQLGRDPALGRALAPVTIGGLPAL